MVSRIVQTDEEYVAEAICDTIQVLAIRLGTPFESFADRVLVLLMDTATVHKKNICDAGMMRRARTRCLDTLTNKTRYSVDMICDYYKKSRASRRRGAKRDLVIKQFGQFQTWTQSDLLPHFLKFNGIFHLALHDEILCRAFKCLQHLTILGLIGNLSGCLPSWSNLHCGVHPKSTILLVDIIGTRHFRVALRDVAWGTGLVAIVCPLDLDERTNRSSVH
ncbi:hypothetical protein Ae201684P_015239 [Aphanomyces euteiches]|nr:hypothetical protein Ae201684P_015239 [Aphanomyces euteiches]